MASIPVAADPASARLTGNRVSNLFTSLRTDLDDPVERLRAIHEVTGAAKEVQGLLGIEMMADWIAYTPPRPYAWTMRQYSRMRLAERHAPPINVIVSNVPGPREPLHIAGATLDGIWSVGPILEGVGLNVTVWSYLDRIHVGVLGCADHWDDLHVVTDGMAASLDELERARPAGRVVCEPPFNSLLRAYKLPGEMLVDQLRWDPFDVEIDTDPYDTWRRMRDEAPVYRNEELDFYALSRYQDVEDAHRDPATYSSSHGTVLEMMSANRIPSGMMIFLDPPDHTQLRSLVSRAFTPRRIGSLEERIRGFCTELLDGWSDGRARSTTCRASARSCPRW